MKKSKYDINKKITPHILRFNQLFRKNVYYNKELERRTKFPYFALTHKGILIALFVVIPLFLFVAFVLCRKVESVNVFDFISLLTSYFCTVAISILVYFYSWVQANKENKENKIKIDAYILPKVEENHDCAFFTREEALREIKNIDGNLLMNEGYNFLEMHITNINPHTVLKITPKKAFASLSKSRTIEYQEILCPRFLNTRINHFFKFEEENIMYVAIDSNYLNQDTKFIKLAIVLEVINEDGESSYMLCTCRGDKTFVDCDVCLVTSKLFQLINKHGTVVLNDVSMYKKTNGKFISLIDLYKC